MSVPETIPGLALQYARELVQDRSHYETELCRLTNIDGVEQLLRTQSLIGISAMGLLSKQFYDMAKSGDTDPSRRLAAATLGGLTLFATDVVDDEIDRREMPLEEKLRYLDAWTNFLVNGEGALPWSQYPRGGNPRGIRASFDLASYLHPKLDRLDGIERLRFVLDPLVEDVKSQMISEDLNKQLDLAIKIGAGCGAICAVAVEIVESTDFPIVMSAATALGGYTECVNHACEIKEDMLEGSQSYASVYIGRNGDNKSSRRAIKDKLLTEASVYLEKSTRGLSSHQKRILYVGKYMVDFKYKLLGRLAKPKNVGR